MLLESYRMHIEPIEILSYSLSAEDGTCIDTDDQFDKWVVAKKPANGPFEVHLRL